MDSKSPTPMSLARVKTRANCGIYAPPVIIEIHLSPGLPGFSLVGLPAIAVKESKERVRSAILTQGFRYPQQRITVNLAPGDLPKQGTRFDLPIALGILVASQQLDGAALADCEIVGELALSGEIRAIEGILPLALACKQTGSALYVPAENAAEAGLVSDLLVRPCRDLMSLCSHLQGVTPIAPWQQGQAHRETPITYPEIADVIGQETAKRALLIAASGGHNLRFVGPPGTGKSMLASRLPGLLPPLSEPAALELAAVRSVAGLPVVNDLFFQRPFRAPHHTASSVALVGGGNPPKPGEISLAHHGVLFLDELPEFSRRVLESLREPLETGEIHIARAAQSSVFPARFQLVAAMNPCPCGYLSHPQHSCTCREDQIQRYHAKLSGPLLERIDMHQAVMPLSSSQLWETASSAGMTTTTLRVAVRQCQQRQIDARGTLNAALSAQDLPQVCQLSSTAKVLLKEVMQQKNASLRQYHRVLRIAQTITDLQEEPIITEDSLAESVSLSLNFQIYQ